MALIITSEEELNQLAPPALPLATEQYSRQYQDQLNNVLRLYFNRITALQQQLSWGQSVDYIDFSLTTAAPHKTGRVDWDQDDATLEIDMDYGVVQQVGQEVYARVSNSTGSAIPNGTVVGFVGATQDSLQVSPYLADGVSPSVYILGVMTHNLPDSGQKGYCTTFGFVRDINTTGSVYGETWVQGDILYASTSVAGGLTNIKPTAPNNVIIVAAVAVVGTLGVIFVRPTIAEQQAYGTFNLTATYSPPLADTAYPIIFNSTESANGVALGTPASRVVVAKSGLYDISCTLQYTSSNSSAKNVYSWIRKNGVDVARSSRILSLNGSGVYSPVLISEAVSLAANDYIEIVVASTNANVSVVASPPTAFAPGSPAANLVVEQIQQ
tara:strand:+ start:963 stop:2111 length:1149 start_codon:yes stop_codon:yes gene_type:complete